MEVEQQVVRKESTPKPVDEASPVEKMAASTPTPPPAEEQEGGGGGACNDYRIDMTAAAFGQCMCGRAKSEHAPGAFGRRGSRREAAS